MSDLVVTKEVLEDSARDLKAINDEFKNMSKLWDDGAVWGHEVLKKAMDDFIDDWWVKREKLQEQLTNLTKKMDEAAKTWTDTEDQLSSTFDQK
jgi:flagellar biosynthesis chaperone FliJ